MIHQSTYSNPSPHTQSHTHTHTHKHKPSNLKQSHTHTIHQTSWSQWSTQKNPAKQKPKPPLPTAHQNPTGTKTHIKKKKKKKKKKKPHRKPRKTSHFRHNSTTTKPHTQTQNINRATHTQTIKPVGANNSHPTHHPSHWSANPSHWLTNPRHWFETQAVENTQKSSPEPPLELPMINPNDPPTDQQIHHFKPTDQLIQTHHQPIPTQWSKPSLPIHANPTSNLKNPKPSTSAMRERLCDERWERGRVRWVKNFGDGWEISAMKL